MARITLYDTLGNTCEADWQRHTGQWTNLYEEDIAECLIFIEKTISGLINSRFSNTWAWIGYQTVSR